MGSYGTVVVSDTGGRALRKWTDGSLSLLLAPSSYQSPSPFSVWLFSTSNRGIRLRSRLTPWQLYQWQRFVTHSNPSEHYPLMSTRVGRFHIAESTR
jgi:hypothetical protein